MEQYEMHYELVKTIMIVFAVIYFLLEVILNLNDIDNDTSNVILLQWSKKQLFIIPFVLGAIGGHLFLGAKTNYFNMGSSSAVIILFVIGLVAVIIGVKAKFERTKTLFSILLILGVAYGHFFWSMNFQN